MVEDIIAVLVAVALLTEVCFMVRYFGMRPFKKKPGFPTRKINAWSLIQVRHVMRTKLKYYYFGLFIFIYVCFFAAVPFNYARTGSIFGWFAYRDENGNPLSLDQYPTEIIRDSNGRPIPLSEYPTVTVNNEAEY